MQTHLMSKIMHQNYAIILQQFNYGKNSFAVLVQSAKWRTQMKIITGSRCYNGVFFWGGGENIENLDFYP